MNVEYRRDSEYFILVVAIDLFTNRAYSHIEKI